MAARLHFRMVDVKNDIGGLSHLQSLATLARALGGEVSGGQIRAPGPGHSAADRSLSVKLDPGAPDGFVVNSFTNDDPIACRDHVRAKAGIAPFKPNGQGRHRAPADSVERALMAAMASQGRESKASRRAASRRRTTTPMPTANCSIRWPGLSRKTFASAGRTEKADGSGSWTSGASRTAGRNC